MKTAFTLIKAAVTPIEAYPDHIPAKKTAYVTYNIADDRGKVFADDTATERVQAIQVHYYCPQGTNYLTTLKTIRDGLVAQGFTYPTVQVLYETDTNSHHLIFECEIELEA